MFSLIKKERNYICCVLSFLKSSLVNVESEAALMKVICPQGRGTLTWMLNLGPVLGFPGSSDGRESACNEGDLGLIPGLGRSPGEGNGNPPQYSCLGSPMNRGVKRALVHGVAESWT